MIETGKDRCQKSEGRCQRGKSKSKRERAWRMVHGAKGRGHGVKMTQQNKQLTNIVITGGCGFIGVNLVRYLLNLDENIRIRIVDNFSVGQPEDLGRVCSIKRLEADQLNGWQDGLNLVEGDILDEGLAEKICRGADGVVHLAANTGVIPSIENPRMDCITNVLGTFTYLDACRKQSVPRFVLASSGAPLGEKVPPIHEEMVPRPISPYGASKLCGEAYCSAFYGSYNLQTVCLRFGNVYGPYSTRKGSVVAKFIKQIISGENLIIYGDGGQTRDFIYIDDLCAAVWASLTTAGVGGEVFQIATHKEHTVSELAEKLNNLALKYLGKSSLVEHGADRRGEVRRNFSDISKALKMLSWEPKWEFANGIEETLKWFLKEADIKRED